jgi:hypothetical protein
VLGPVLAFVGFALLALLLGFLSHKKEMERRRILGAWAGEQGFTFRFERDGAIEQRFPLFTAFRKGSNRYGYNVMEGSRNGRPVCCFDHHHETYSTDSKGRRTTHHHHASAVLLHAGHPLKSLFVRPEGFFDSITALAGFDDIDFELGEFSRAFYVKAPERRWAFDVLHQATMEFLLHAPRFHLEMEGPWLLVRRERRFSPEEFRQALDVGEGVLDRLPEYLLRELKGAGA